MIDLSHFAGFQASLESKSLSLVFGPGVTTAPVVVRHLDEVRPMLRDPQARGPDQLYTIYMDIRVPGVTETLRRRGLGYGAVVYNHGALGREALRSQGHVHSVGTGGLAYSELYEFWHGRGVVYMQDVAGPDVGDVIVVEAEPGDKVAIPPGWAHATVNAGGGSMVFGAVYALEAELLYEPLRRMRGTAHAVLADGTFEPNPTYHRVPEPRRRRPLSAAELGAVTTRPALEVLAADESRLDFVSRPEAFPRLWETLTGPGA